MLESFLPRYILEGLFSLWFKHQNNFIDSKTDSSDNDVEEDDKPYGIPFMTKNI